MSCMVVWRVVVEDPTPPGDVPAVFGFLLIVCTQHCFYRVYREVDTGAVEMLWFPRSGNTKSLLFRVTGDHRANGVSEERAWTEVPAYSQICSALLREHGSIIKATAPVKLPMYHCLPEWE